MDHAPPDLGGHSHERLEFRLGGDNRGYGAAPVAQVEPTAVAGEPEGASHQ